MLTTVITIPVIVWFGYNVLKQISSRAFQAVGHGVSPTAAARYPNSDLPQSINFNFEWGRAWRHAVADPELGALFNAPRPVIHYIRGEMNDDR
jgi:hypothetical protein